MTRSLIRIFANTLIFAAFGLFFAYAVWEGIGNFLGIVNQAAQLHLGITAFGWVCMYANVLLPVVVWGALAVTLVATIVSRSRAKADIPVWRFVVGLTLGLALTAVISADIVLGLPAGAIFVTGTAG